MQGNLDDALEDLRLEVENGADLESVAHEIAQECRVRVELLVRKFTERLGSVETVRARAAARRENTLPSIDYAAAETGLRVECLRFGIRKPDRFLPLIGKKTVIIGHRATGSAFYSIVFDCRSAKAGAVLNSTLEGLEKSLGFKPKP